MEGPAAIRPVDLGGVLLVGFELPRPGRVREVARRAAPRANGRPVEALLAALADRGGDRRTNHTLYKIDHPARHGRPCRWAGDNGPPVRRGVLDDLHGHWSARVPTTAAVEDSAEVAAGKLGRHSCNVTSARTELHSALASIARKRYAYRPRSRPPGDRNPRNELRASVAARRFRAATVPTSPGRRCQPDRTHPPADRPITSIVNSGCLERGDLTRPFSDHRRLAQSRGAAAVIPSTATGSPCYDFIRLEVEQPRNRLGRSRLPAGHYFRLVKGSPDWVVPVFAGSRSAGAAGRRWTPGRSCR